MADLSRNPGTELQRRLFVLAAGTLAFGLLAGTPLARAHIETTGALMSRGGDQKNDPCDGAKGAGEVYSFKPGATINVSIVETVPHPGYFRISFDADGEDGFVNPSGTDGAMGDCAGDAKCGAGKSDFCSNETVLLDHLDQHAAGSFGQRKTYTWSVKLPNVECENCTLQIIQMMNDFNFHPQPYPADDIYYRCIDIKLSNSAPDVTTTPVMNNGMVCAGAQQPAAGSGGSGAAGGGAGMMAGTAGASGQPAAAGSSASAGTGAGAPAAGTAASASAGTGGSSATPSQPATGGTPAAGSPSRPAAGGAGAAPSPATAGAGTTMGAVTAAGGAAPAPAPEVDSGCSTLPGHGGNPGALAFGLVALLIGSLRRRRRTRSNT